MNDKLVPKKNSVKTDFLALCGMILVLSSATLWYAHLPAFHKTLPVVVKKPPVQSNKSVQFPASASATTIMPLQSLGTPVQCATNTTLNVVAHQDDDLLFLSPDLLHDITAKRCIRSVYLTAGDAGQPYRYWHSRELAVEAAYAYMYDVPNIWHEDKATIAGHQVRVSTLNTKPELGMIFMALPDGHPSGKGFGLYKNESLTNLRKGTLQKIHSVDTTSSYSKQELVATLRAIMDFDKPSEIHTQNPDHLSDGDHSDHHAAGYFTHLARNGYAQKNVLRSYKGYPMGALPINMSNPQDIAVKHQAFLIYMNHDPQICPTISCALARTYEKYLLRQYSTVAPSSDYLDQQHAYLY